jgi:sugar O-acyltransferase (sialic acid O-acetyltransferase NeuD family)
MNRSYYIYGASGHSKVIIEIIEKACDSIKGIYDDDPDKRLLFNYSVSNEKSMLAFQDASWIIGIGENAIRKKLAESYLLNYGNAIHDSANISKRAELGVGTVVMAGVTINCSSIIGNHVIINTNASVDHDCIIGNYAHISPNATLCGGVTLGEGTHIGAGAVIIPGITIGKWVKVGAGAVIINDLPDFTTVVGNPGKIIKTGKADL